MAKKSNPVTKRREMKFTWLANAPHTNSGYAVETRDLLFRFLKDGWDCACIGNFGAEGYHHFSHGQDLIGDRFKDLKLKVYSKMNDAYGTDAMLNHSIDYKAQVAFGMLDWWCMNPQGLAEMANRGIKVIPFIPIDQEPVPPGVLNNLRYVYKIITFSKFGQQALEKEGFASHLIVEGTDLDIFKPMDKLEMRKKIGLPADAFIFGMVAANKENPPRKAFQEVLEAFAMFEKNHKDAYIFFHTQQITGGGFPIREYARYLNIPTKVIFLDAYLASFKSDSFSVAQEINACDVYLNPSMTEGFGLGIVEAQACGVPVIVNGCHSMPELVLSGKTGEICETGKQFWRNLNGYVYMPNVESLHEKMEKLYLNVKENPEQIKKDCREHVMANYNIDTLVQEKWIPFLEELQEELLPKVE